MAIGTGAREPGVPDRTPAEPRQKSHAFPAHFPLFPGLRADTPTGGDVAEWSKALPC